MRYFIELSYKGTRYNGWQLQENAPSVQGELQRALSLILRRQISVTGAGRTDTGVHALYYVAHFDYDSEIEDLARLCYKLNTVLPDDIAVRAIYRVEDDLHARFSAVSREYKYFIRTGKDPFSRETSWQYYVSLDIDRMNEAAAWLLEFEDFTTFAKLNSGNKTNICHVSHARWERVGECNLLSRKEGLVIAKNLRMPLDDINCGDNASLEGKENFTGKAYEHQIVKTDKTAFMEVEEKNIHGAFPDREIGNMDHISSPMRTTPQSRVEQQPLTEEREKEDMLVFTIRANRFLRNMVRAIVGTLVDVGRGKITPEQFRDLIAAKNLSLSSTSAPAQGLFLSNVEYSFSVSSHRLTDDC